MAAKRAAPRCAAEPAFTDAEAPAKFL